MHIALLNPGYHEPIIVFAFKSRARDPTAHAAAPPHRAAKEAENTPALQRAPPLQWLASEGYVTGIASSNRVATRVPCHPGRPRLDHWLARLYPAALSKRGYLPYGASATMAGTFAYTAQRVDHETNGLYYYRARMYTRAWGRC